MTEGNKTSLLELVEKNLVAEKEVTVSIGEDSVKFMVYPVVSIEKKERMVHRIYKLVFITDTETIADYDPAILDFAVRYVLVTSLTNLELPDGVEDAWKILKYTDIYDTLLSNSKVAIETAKDALKLINDRLDYLKNKTDINALFTKLADKIGEMSIDLKDVDVSKLMDTFQKIPKDGSMTDMVKAILGTQEEGKSASSVS